MVGSFFIMSTELAPKGTPEEVEEFIRVRSNYDRASDDLRIRTADFDKKDELFRTHINADKWPYRTQVADPSIFTFIIEKTSRLISNKLKGKVVPREGSDWLKARVANSLLDFYWDVAQRGGSMIQKWAVMDMNTRKYGAAFAVVPYHYETTKGKTESNHDNPEFDPINNRDCLPNPDHSEIKHWFQYRRYPTFDELVQVNEMARAKPIYKNLDILRQSLSEKGTEKGDRRDVNWISRNKTIKGLTDTLGDDKHVKYIEVVKEIRPDKIVTFAPKHGIILQEEENPWGEINIIHLRYYMIDDDIYGLSEIEPIEKLQRAENALISQYFDSVNNDLYPPLLVRATGVQMHTLEFGPNKKWIMNDPATDVKRFETSTNSTQKFTATVSFIISRMQIAMGETGQGISNIDPFSPGKTATEVRDQALQRLARDNFNQIFLSEALKKQMLLWLKQASILLTKDKMVQIIGEDSLRFFKEKMMRREDDINSPDLGNLTPFGPNEAGLEGPIHGVKKGNELVPKFSLDETGEVGQLIVEPKDLDGLVDYIPDVESMSIQRSSQSRIKLFALDLLTKNPQLQQQLLQEGVTVRYHELLTEMLEDAGFKDARRFFGPAEASQLGGGLNGQTQAGIQPKPAGGGATPGGVSAPRNAGDKRLVGGTETRTGEENKIGAV